MTDPVRCFELVDDNSSMWPQSHGCSRAMKVTRDGKPYCNQHDPIAINAKWEARRAAAQAEQNTQEQIQKAANSLTTQLGVGRPEFSLTRSGYTGGIVLSAEEAQRVIGWLETLRKAQCKNG